MENEIVAVLGLFDANQIIRIYKNDECVKTVSCKMPELENAIFGLAIEFNTRKINLAGSDIIAQKVRRNFVTRYGNYNFDINII
jgi:hypothetical protein